METRNSSFEDHLDIVESAYTKTAGLDQSGDSILNKLAAELGFEKDAEEGITAPAAPANEGEVSPAAASVAGAASPVASATAAVTDPQMQIAGGNLEESAAGEIPAATKPNEGLAISAGDGGMIDANELHKTPEAIALASQGAVAPAQSAGGSPAAGGEKAEEAEKVGALMARSFLNSIEKSAEDDDYTTALEILDENGLLDGYNIHDLGNVGLDKTAGFEEDCLEKIANSEALSRNDIIGAACEYVEMEKDAELADDAGRETAELVSLEMDKIAADQQGREDAHAFVEELQEQEKLAEEAEEEYDEEEKVAALLQDPQVVAAVKILKANNLL